MLSLSISNAILELSKYRKIQCNMSQNGELVAGSGDGADFCWFADLAFALPDALSPTLSHREREKTEHALFPRPLGKGRTANQIRRTIGSLAPPGRGLGRGGVSQPTNYRRKKTCFKKQVFQMWSAREDSNLRPTGPKPVALPSCATRRMRSASYCCDAPPSIPFIANPYWSARNSPLCY
jgi:hypothetical protein